MFFDTETTGGFGHPDLVSICWMLFEGRNCIRSEHHIIRPDNFKISPRSTEIHGISHEYAMQVGKPLADVIPKFFQHLRSCQLVVSHNISFDRRAVNTAAKRLNMLDAAELWREPLQQFCTFRGICDHDNAKKLPGEARAPKDGINRRLEAVYLDTFGEPLVGAHTADADADALQRLFWARFGHLEDHGLPLRPPPLPRLPHQQNQPRNGDPALAPAVASASGSASRRRRRQKRNKNRSKAAAPAPIPALIPALIPAQVLATNAVEVDMILNLGRLNLRDDDAPLVLVSPRPSTTSVFHKLSGGCGVLAEKAKKHTLMQAQAIHGRNDEPLRPCQRCWPQGLPDGVRQ
jgi:DNA polymerase III epsilon subunit-like protein